MSIAVTNHQAQKQLGQERLYFCLYFHVAVHQRGKLRQEPGGRSSHRGHRGVLLTSLLLMACSSCFLIQFRTTVPELEPLMVEYPPHQLLIKKGPHVLSYRPNRTEAFSQFRVPNYSSLCQVGIKVTNTRFLICFLLEKCPHILFVKEVVVLSSSTVLYKICLY